MDDAPSQNTIGLVERIEELKMKRMHEDSAKRHAAAEPKPMDPRMIIRQTETTAK